MGNARKGGNYDKHKIIEDNWDNTCWIEVTDEFKSETGIITFDKVAVRVDKYTLDRGTQIGFNDFDGEIRLYTCGKCIEISSSEWLNFTIK